MLAGAVLATAQEIVWEEHTIPIENLRINDLALVDAETAWAVGVVDIDPGTRPPQVVPTIIHTADGGETWNEQETGVERGVLNAICLVETEMAVAVGQDHGTRAPLVLWTADGGQRWSRATLPPVQGQGTYATLSSQATALVGASAMITTNLNRCSGTQTTCVPGLHNPTLSKRPLAFRRLHFPHRWLAVP